MGRHYKTPDELEESGTKAWKELDARHPTPHPEKALECQVLP